MPRGKSLPGGACPGARVYQGGHAPGQGFTRGGMPWGTRFYQGGHCPGARISTRGGIAPLCPPVATSLVRPVRLYCKSRAAGLFLRAAGQKRAGKSQEDQFTNEYTVNSRYIEVRFINKWDKLTTKLLQQVKQSLILLNSKIEHEYYYL